MKTPWVGLTAMALAGAVLGYLVKIPCRFGGGWMYGTQYEYGCYSDIFPLYYRDGLDTGTVPYLDQPVEYPVLTGGLMHLIARSVSWLPDTTSRALGYFDLTAAVLAVALVSVVLGTGHLAGRGGAAPAGRPFDRRSALLAGGFVALVPAAFLTAYINWDLLAVVLVTGGLVGYAHGRQWLGGGLIGLAVAAKFYPFLFFGPLFVLVLRRLLGKEGGIPPGDFLRPLAGAAIAWTAVNLPVYLAAPEGWAMFFEFSRERGADWGSVYYILAGFGLLDTADQDLVNLVGMIALGAACAGIAALGMFARRGPSLEQMVFLTVAAFLITNKVWSPQFVLWLLPLAVLAFPRTVRPWPAVALYGLWQLAEVGYFFGIWQHLRYVGLLDEGAAPAGLDFGGYVLVALGRLFSLLMVCALVVVDSLRNGDSRA